MIVEAVIQFIAQLVSDLIGVLPTGTFEPDLSGLGGVIGGVKSLSSILPVSAVLVCLAATTTYFGASWAYHGLNWVYRHIPFVGGG